MINHKVSLCQIFENHVCKIPPSQREENKKRQLLQLAVMTHLVLALGRGRTNQKTLPNLNKGLISPKMLLTWISHVGSDCQFRKICTNFTQPQNGPDLSRFLEDFFLTKKHQPSGHQLSKINPFFFPFGLPPPKKGAQINYSKYTGIIRYS